MADVHDTATRSRNMAAIRGKNTKQEVWLRKSLFRRGFRYRIHPKALPGKPDIVFPKYRAVVFFHGCFWHGHNCYLFVSPSTRKEFWSEKISSNRRRDAQNKKNLIEQGWRVAEVWECAIKGKNRLPDEQVLSTLEYWIRNIDTDTYEISSLTSNSG